MRSAFRGPAYQLAVRMRINNCTHGHNYYYGPSNQPCMHDAPATARVSRVCILVPFIKMAFKGCFSFYSKVIRVFVFGNVLGIMVKYQILLPLSRRAFYFALNW